MLKDIIPAALRSKVYIGVALLGFALGGTQVGFAAAKVDQPVWLVVAFAVYGFVVTAVGFTAASNTPNLQGRHEAE
ncbi:hypothetical protein JTF08_13805 [Micrococcaceae bacterium RIT802]|nr:hypothetical protein [Micrococcaceae bacterium RIT 802]